MSHQRSQEEKFREEELADGTFPVLRLSDDLIALVLSFVSTAPFENPEGNLLQEEYLTLLREKKEKSNSSSSCICNFGTLTHVLPLVCHKFRRICKNSDVLWKGAMARLVMQKSCQPFHVWREGLARLSLSDSEQNQKVFDAGPTTASTMSHLLDKATSVILEREKRSDAAMALFQEIVKEYQPFIWVGPIFFLVSDHDQGMDQEINLHLFEKRYRLMMSQLMENHHQCDKNGNTIPTHRRPRFFFSSGLSTPLRAGDPVTLVEVTHCVMKEDGRAMVTVVPLEHKTLISTKASPDSFNLVNATVTTTQKIRDKTFTGPIIRDSTIIIPSQYAVIRIALVEECYRIILNEITPEIGNPRFILSASINKCQPAAVVEVLRVRVDGDDYTSIEVVIVAKGAILQEPIMHSTIQGVYTANIDIEHVEN